MAERRSYSFSTEPAGEAYDLLLEASSIWCSKFLLVLRDETIRSTACDRAVHGLSSALIRTERRNEWPGTVLTSGTAELLTYANTAASRRTLKKLAGSLYDWIHPELPEDLAFLREDASTWLGSAAHEGDSFLLLTPYEYDQLTKRAPEVAGMLVPDADIGSVRAPRP